MLVDDGAFNFAIETSGRIGEIALGQADRIIASAPVSYTHLTLPTILLV